MRTVAIIGAGQQGRLFALRCAEVGHLTVLEDVMPARLRQAREELDQRGEPDAAGRLQFATTVEEAVRHADIVVDFVPDELESKLEIFSMIDRMAPPKTVLCSPTAVLSIADLASCTYRADRCVGLRGTPAVREGEAVTLVRTELTAARALDDVQAFLTTLGFQVAIAMDAEVAYAAGNLL